MNCLTGNAVGKANAVGINAAVVDAATYSLDTTSAALVSKVVALGTDGAAVMKELDQLLLDLYILYHCSTLNRCMLNGG